MKNKLITVYPNTLLLFQYMYINKYVTGPAKIDHVSAKNCQVFCTFSIIT